MVPELGPEVWDTLRCVFDTGRPFALTNWRVPYDQDRDGTVEDHWFNVAYTPLREAGGMVSGLIAVLTEVTAQEQARQQLERTNRELTRVNRELEEFAYVTSHDLQEPLRMVNIYSQLLLKHQQGEPAQLDQYGYF